MFLQQLKGSGVSSACPMYDVLSWHTWCYRKFLCLSQMACVRAEKLFLPCESDNPEDQVKPMLDWAKGGFLPKGEEGLKPTHSSSEQSFRATPSHFISFGVFCFGSRMNLCFVGLSADNNPLDHQILNVPLHEYFASAKRSKHSFCKNKAVPEESCSRGTWQRSHKLHTVVIKNKN